MFILPRLLCLCSIITGACILGAFFIILLSAAYVEVAIWNQNFTGNLRYVPVSVNIDTTNISGVPSADVEFIIEGIAQTVLYNTGQSLQTTNQADNAANATGGALGNNTFVYLGFTYYWTSNDTSGQTGTTVNGQGYPYEVRALFKNNKYSDISQAVQNPDGLAELVFLFRICTTLNAPFDQLSTKIQNITTAGSSTSVPLSMHFNAVSFADLNEFYSYSGSFLDTATGRKFNCSTVMVSKPNPQYCITHDQFNKTFSPLKNFAGQQLVNTLSHDSSVVQASLNTIGVSGLI